MTDTFKMNRSSSLNLEGVSPSVLLAFLNSLPQIAREEGKLEVSSTPYMNQFDRGHSSVKVSWYEDLGSPR